MKLFLVSLISIFSLTIATAKTKKVETVVNDNAPVREVSSTTGMNRWSIGPSLGVVGGGFGFGGDANFMFRLSPQVPLFVGGQTGFYIVMASAGTTTATVFFIPLMASMYYKFDVPQSNLHPYLGASIGMNIYFGSVSASTFATYTGSGAGFAFLVRPGLEFPLSGNSTLAIETKFGVFSGGFVFLPHAGFTFKF